MGSPGRAVANEGCRRSPACSTGRASPAGTARTPTPARYLVRCPLRESDGGRGPFNSSSTSRSTARNSCAAKRVHNAATRASRAGAARLARRGAGGAPPSRIRSSAFAGQSRASDTRANVCGRKLADVPDCSLRSVAGDTPERAARSCWAKPSSRWRCTIAWANARLFAARACTAVERDMLCHCLPVLERVISPMARTGIDTTSIRAPSVRLAASGVIGASALGLRYDRRATVVHVECG